MEVALGGREGRCVPGTGSAESFGRRSEGLGRRARCFARRTGCFTRNGGCFGRCRRVPVTKARYSGPYKAWSKEDQFVLGDQFMLAIYQAKRTMDP